MNEETYKKLLNPAILTGDEVTVIGEGSGGGWLTYHIARAGFHRINLIDMDRMELRNIYGHLADATSIGKLKVDVVKEHILKRNPDAVVTTLCEDITKGEQWKELVLRSTVVVIATDSVDSRALINKFCVENQISTVTGKVYNAGVGGEIFQYIPYLETGCHHCLDMALSRLDRAGVNKMDLLTEEQREEIYRRGITEIENDPGLYLDIAFLPLFHARKVLETALLLKSDHVQLKKIANLYVWANHAKSPFKEGLVGTKFHIGKNPDCPVCNGEDEEVILEFNFEEEENETEA